MIEIPISINKISYDPEQKGYLVTLKSLQSESFLNILVGTKAAKEISEDSKMSVENLEMS